MSENLQKFLFLGVLMVSIVLGGDMRGSENNIAKNDYTSISASAVESKASLNHPSPDQQSSLPPAVSSSATSLPAVSLPLNGMPSLRSGASPSLSAFRRTGEEAPPYTQARIALIADLNGDGNYFGKDINDRWPMASLTKLMTAALALKSMDLKSSVQLQPSDFSGTSESPAEYLKAGDVYSVEDLLKIMLLASRNEAANALARSYGYARFMAGLDGLSQDFHLVSTYFDDPSGLSASNQSTVEDIKKFAEGIYNRYRSVFIITTQDRLSVDELSSGQKYSVSSINSFAGDPDFLGGKTGYTDEAGGNLLSVFSYEGKPVLIIVLGSGDRFGDTQALLSWFERNFR